MLEWLKRWEDDLDESDMKLPHLSYSSIPIVAAGTGVSDKGKEPER
jgi:hypothetical protein